MTQTENPTKGRGCPRFQPTADQRKTVLILTGNAIGQDIIAQVIGCSEPTLRRAFKKELKGGVAYLRALCATTVARNLAAGGSVGQRAAEYIEQTRFGISKYAPPPATKSPEIGKKAELEEAAAPGNEPREWANLLN